MSYPTFGSGVNIDPLYSPANPDPVSGFGMDKIHGFRYTSRNHPGQLAYLDSAKAAGKHLMAIVTGESEGYVDPRADILQIGNEPDVATTGLSPSDYAATWNLYRNTYDGDFGYFALAGLGSGLGPARAYLSGVWPLLDKKPDLVAVHLYDGDVTQATYEIDDLWNAVGVPVICTEWNHAQDQIWDLRAMLAGRCSAWDSYYPYTTAMNSSTQGLVDAEGNPTDYGAGFVSAPYV